MARKKAKTKSKAKRGTRVAKGRKVSKARMAKAGNACCPVIRTVCSPTFTMKTETITGDDTVVKRKVKVAGPNKCKVSMGSKTWKNLTTDAKDAKVKELSTALTAKRCQAVVEDYHQKKAEKATSKLLKFMY